MKILSSISLFMIFVSLLGCSSQQKNNSGSGKKTNDIYRSAGIERFFLPELTRLGRVSEISRCIRPPVQYFDFLELSKKYGFTYEQSLSLQVFFSRKKQNQFLRDKKVINQLFYESFGEVDSGAKILVKVRSKSLYIIAIDSFITHSSKQLIGKLHKVIEEKLLPKAQVAFISKCLTSKDVERFVNKHEFYSQIVPIGAEFFTHYNDKSETEYFWSINIDKLLKNKKIIYIIRKENEKEFIQGTNKIWNFSNL